MPFANLVQRQRVRQSARREYLKAVGKGALDLGVLYHGAKYAVEVKLRYLWDRSPEKALEQVRRYTDHLGVGEGWLVVFDPDMAKPWDEKIAREDRTVDGRPIHVFYC